MKHASLIFTALSITLFMAHAHAWGGKLNPADLQGNYTYEPTPDTSLNCPDTLSVTYNAAAATLSSEIFMLDSLNNSHVVLDGGIKMDPATASYTANAHFTKVSSKAITRTEVEQHTTSDTSGLPIFPEPLDIGSPQTKNLIDTVHTITTKVTYNSKTRILKKTVEVNVYPSGLLESCSYQKD
jgi:hypothetical protein